MRARLDAQAHRDGAAAEQLRGDISRVSASTVCDKRELRWPRHLVNFRLTEVLKIAAAAGE